MHGLETGSGLTITDLMVGVENRAGLAAYYGKRAIKEARLGNASNAEWYAQVAGHHVLELRHVSTHGGYHGGGRVKSVHSELPLNRLPADCCKCEVA